MHFQPSMKVTFMIVVGKATLLTSDSTGGKMDLFTGGHFLKKESSSEQF